MPNLETAGVKWIHLRGFDLPLWVDSAILSAESLQHADGLCTTQFHHGNPFLELQDMETARITMRAS